MPADVNLQQMCTFVFFTQMISVNAVHVLNTAVPVIHVIIMPISVLFVAYSEVLAWLSVWSEVQTCIWSSRCHCHSLSLASLKSRFVLPFWYWLTRVVPDKGPLNGCVCVCCGIHNTWGHVLLFQEWCHTASQENNAMLMSLCWTCLETSTKKHSELWITTTVCTILTYNDRTVTHSYIIY